MRDCREQTDAKAGHLVLVTSRAQEELIQVTLQVRPEGVPSGYQPHCSPLRWAINCNVGLPPCSYERKTIQKNPCDYKGHTHTPLPRLSSPSCLHPLVHAAHTMHI